jgi:hypothetical protein
VTPRARQRFGDGAVPRSAGQPLEQHASGEHEGRPDDQGCAPQGEPPPQDLLGLAKILAHVIVVLMLVLLPLLPFVPGWPSILAEGWAPPIVKRAADQ